MNYAKCVERGIDHKPAMVADDLSDIEYLETYSDYTAFRKENPGIQIILVARR